MVTAIVGIGELLKDFGLSVAALQSKVLTPDEKTNLFWFNTAIGAALTVVVAFAAWPIALLYDDERLIAITQAISVTFLISGIATQFKAQINRDLRFQLLGACETFAQALGLAAAVSIAVVTHSYWALVAQAVSVAIIEALLCMAFSRWRPGWYRRGVSVGRFLRFAGALVGTQGMAYLSKNIDSVLLGTLRGPADLGLYNRAYQIVVLPLTQVTAPLSRVAIPVLSRLQDSMPIFVRYLKTAQFATVTATAIFYGMLIGFSDPLIRITLGSAWVSAVPILQLLAISGIFRALSQVPYWAFVTLGQTNKQLIIYLVGQPFIVAAIAIGALWGASGVAAGGAVGYAVFWLLNMWWAGRITKIPAGELALSGIALVAVFALPIAAAGTTAVHYLGGGWLSLAVGGLPTLALIAGALTGIPRYRAEVARFIRLARRSSDGDNTAPPPNTRASG